MALMMLAPTATSDVPGSRRLPALARALVLILALAIGPSACSGPTPDSVQAPVPTVEGWEAEAIATLGATPAPVPVTIGLPYQPDVQFTPLYVADAKGYYRDEGFDVSFRYGDESDFIRLAAAREDITAVVASGEQVILARGQGIPVTYVMTWYQRFAGAVFSDDLSIQKPADLVGRKVGLPAPSGASYSGWLALLSANDIDARSVTTEIIGFRQLEAVLQGQVDAAVGYAANEPVQARQRGVDVAVIEIADSFNLVSNGLVVAEGLILESPEVVQALVTGTLKGIRDTLDDPDAAFELALQVVLEAADPSVRDVQRQILGESLRFWDGPQLGSIDAAAWERTQEFLVEAGITDTRTPVAEMIDSRFVDAAGITR